MASMMTLVTVLFGFWFGGALLAPAVGTSRRRARVAFACIYPFATFFAFRMLVMPSQGSLHTAANLAVTYLVAFQMVYGFFGGLWLFAAGARSDVPVRALAWLFVGGLAGALLLFFASSFLGGPLAGLFLPLSAVAMVVPWVLMGYGIARPLSGADAAPVGL
jgi:hypothetical protein